VARTCRRPARRLALPKPQAGVWKFGDADGGFSLGRRQEGPSSGIKMEFSYEDPTAFSLLIIEFGPKEGSPCITYSESAQPG
jgi:hypothetical protein